MRYLKKFESINYLFSEGDYVRFTNKYLSEREKRFYVKIITRDTIYQVITCKNLSLVNHYLLEEIVGSEVGNMSTEEENDLELVQDYEVDAIKYNL